MDTTKLDAPLVRIEMRLRLICGFDTRSTIISLSALYHAHAAAHIPFSHIINHRKQIKLLISTDISAFDANDHRLLLI